MENVFIDDNVLMANHIYILDNNHGFYKGYDITNPEIPPIKQGCYINPIQIESNVRIDEGLVIMSGISVGKGSIISTNSIVTKNIPPYVIIIESPAKLIKQYNFEAKKWKKI